MASRPTDSEKAVALALLDRLCDGLDVSGYTREPGRTLKAMLAGREDAEHAARRLLAGLEAGMNYQEPAAMLDDAFICARYLAGTDANR
jgi:hypothetical protein